MEELCLVSENLIESSELNELNPHSDKLDGTVANSKREQCVQ